MKKFDLLKVIAEKGYDVGFGAKKHFATYDIVNKAPNFISVISISIGIFALFIDTLSSKHISAILIVVGIFSLVISFYDEKKEEYLKVGTKSTQLYNQLKELYYKVNKKDIDDDFSENIAQLDEIQNEFYEISLGKQILLSDWYAHYKFFWQHQFSWLEEQLKFSFWRDKVPLSLL
jgi:hypothetical protein